MQNAKARLLASLAVAALGLSTARCGGSGAGGSFNFSLYLDGAAPAPIAFWQVGLIKNGHLRDCATVELNCLKPQLGGDKEKMVPLTDSQGHEHPAVLFPNQAATGGTQDVSVTAAVGSDYTLIIEALTADSPPQWVGTSCTPLPDGIHSGTNQVLAEPMKVNAAPVACDARWE